MIFAAYVPFLCTTFWHKLKSIFTFSFYASQKTCIKLPTHHQASVAHPEQTKYLYNVYFELYIFHTTYLQTIAKKCIVKCTITITVSATF